MAKQQVEALELRFNEWTTKHQEDQMAMMRLIEENRVQMSTTMEMMQTMKAQMNSMFVERIEKNKEKIGENAALLPTPPIPGHPWNRLGVETRFEGGGSVGGVRFEGGSSATDDRMTGIGHRLPRMDFPRFNGEEVRSWLLKCKKYFLLHAIVDEHKVLLAALHLEGKADTWFQAFNGSGRLIAWEEFEEVVANRFKEVSRSSVIGEFNKLQQESSVAAYLEKFEELMPLVQSQNGGLGESYFLESFLSGLKDEIKHPIMMFGPVNLNRAIHLAKLQEATLVGSSVV